MYATQSRTTSKRSEAVRTAIGAGISPTKRSRQVESPMVLLTPPKNKHSSRSHSVPSQRKQTDVCTSPVKLDSDMTGKLDSESGGDLSDSSDENAENRMRRFKEHQNRIRQSKQELIKKLAIVEMTNEIRKATAQQKLYSAANRSQNKILKQAAAKALPKRQSLRLLKKDPQGIDLPPEPIEDNVAAAKALPKRQSLRLLKKDPQGIDLPPEPIEELEEEKRKPASQFPLEAVGFDPASTDMEGLKPEKVKKIEESFIDYKAFLDDMREMNHDPDDTKYVSLGNDELQSHQKQLRSMKTTVNQVRKVVKGRIFSLALHPSTDITLVAAGDKYGNLGLWNSTKNDSNGGAYQFTPHISPISCLKFAFTCPNRLYMCSYDGQLRFLDLQKNVFEETVVDEESAEMSCFDFLDHDRTMITSRADGMAQIIDTRAKSEQMTFVAHNKAAKCISVNPRDKNYVATSCRDSGVHIFDLRKVSYKSSQPKPVVAVGGHSKSVSSAYFSPISGNHLLTTSYDNHLRIFDTSMITNEKVSLKSSCYHNNHTGRWLSSFRASWHPRLDDVFVVGSMNPSRQIEIFDSSATLVHALSDPHILTSICSTNCFHPTRNILAGGNSSGKVFVFSD